VVGREDAKMASGSMDSRIVSGESMAAAVLRVGGFGDDLAGGTLGSCAHISRARIRLWDPDALGRDERGEALTRGLDGVAFTDPDVQDLLALFLQACAPESVAAATAPGSGRSILIYAITKTTLASGWDWSEERCRARGFAYVAAWNRSGGGLTFAADVICVVPHIAFAGWRP